MSFQRFKGTWVELLSTADVRISQASSQTLNVLLPGIQGKRIVNSSQKPFRYSLCF